MLGTALIVFAMIIYPLFGFFNGHVYPVSPTFGLPCPTTIFTLGVLLIAFKNVPWIAVAIPLTWSVIGFMAALKFGITEDFGLLAAGIITVILLIIEHSRSGVSSPTKKSVM